MKKLILRLSIIVLLAVLYFPLNNHLKKLNKGFSNTVVFRFKSSLYYRVARKHRTTRFKQLLAEKARHNRIENVYISGSFCDWAEKNKSFKMEKIGLDKWKIKIRIPAGKYGYKFVIHTRPHKKGQPKKRPIWCRDYAAQLSEDDTYGGRNSVFISDGKEMVFMFTKNMLLKKMGTTDAASLRRIESQKIPKVIIHKVYISGAFSDWSINNKNFLMKKNTPDSWIIALKLSPGDHQYKYVVHARVKNDPAGKTFITWCQDLDNVHTAPDSFGGANSVRQIASYKNEKFLLDVITLSVILGIIIFTILEYVLRLLFLSKISLKNKLVFIFILLLFISNIVFIFYSYRQAVSFVKKSQIDKLNILHSMLLAGGVSFSEIFKDKQKMEGILNGFFKHTSMRQKYLGHSNRKQQIIRLFYLDLKGD